MLMFAPASLAGPSSSPPVASSIFFLHSSECGFRWCFQLILIAFPLKLPRRPLPTLSRLLHCTRETAEGRQFMYPSIGAKRLSLNERGKHKNPCPNSRELSLGAKVRKTSRVSAICIALADALASQLSNATDTVAQTELKSLGLMSVIPIEVPFGDGLAPLFANVTVSLTPWHTIYRDVDLFQRSRSFPSG